MLRPLLDDASSATFAGNFAVSLTLGAIAAPLQIAYGFDDDVRQSVWNKPPIDLERENQAKLLALGVPERTVRDLLRNTWFTPTLQTALVARLAVLGRIDGLESVVRTAVAIQGEARARFLLESLAMLALHHEKGGRVARILVSDLVPVGGAAHGSIIVAAATDYGVRIEDVAAIAQRLTIAPPERVQEALIEIGDAIKARMSWTLENIFERAMAIQSTQGFPLEYREHLRRNLATAGQMQVYVGSTIVTVSSEWDTELGTKEDLERAYHYGALLEDGTVAGVDGPWPVDESQLKIQDAEARHAYFEAIRYGRNEIDLPDGSTRKIRLDMN